MANQNLSAYRGDTVSFPLTFKDKDGNPVDITGWIIFFTLKEEIDDVDNDSAAKITKTITDHDDPTNGETSLKLLSSDTYDLDKVNYKYDFQYKTSSGDIKTFLSGSFKFNKDVTRRTS